ARLPAAWGMVRPDPATQDPRLAVCSLDARAFVGLTTIRLRQQYPSWCRSSVCSDGPSTEQVEAGPAESLALNQLQFRDLSLGLAIAPLVRQGGFDRGLVPADPLREALELGHLAGAGRVQPREEGRHLALPDHAAKPLDQGIGGRHGRTG